MLRGALLLAHDLPVVVLNSDDKECYLDALGKSNDGSLDSLLDLFADLMDQSLLEILEIGERRLDLGEPSETTEEAMPMTSTRHSK